MQDDRAVRHKWMHLGYRYPDAATGKEFFSSCGMGMYTIDISNDCICVTIRNDFDYSTIKRILHDELVIPGFCRLHEVWLVGTHRAQVRLGELQTIVDDFSRLCPREVIDKKMAFVAEPGLTSAILELLADGLDRKLALSCRTFRSREAAEEWIGLSASQVA